MSDNTGTYEEMRANLRQQALDSWAGSLGEERAAALDEFLDKKLVEYSRVLKISKPKLLRALETQRNYTAINYYQEANFPSLDGVLVLPSKKAFKALAKRPEFRCPSCEQISKNPYECDTGHVTDGKTCDWKSFGLFGTMGKGLRVIVRRRFLTHAVVHEIFMPVAMEGA